MLDDWFRTIELGISLEEFNSLPRHAAYKYEYLGGSAWLTPDPRYGRALLDLASIAPPAALQDGSASGSLANFTRRPFSDADWGRLAGLMAAAFEQVPPFCALDSQTAVAAARDCLRHTREGGDGPLILPACFVAEGPHAWDNPAGAILVTLVPPGDLTEWHSLRWQQPPPPDAIERRLGQPHLTWIFSSPRIAGHGLGTELLRLAAANLRSLGFTELASTFLIGNVRSMTWHWRNGFRLVQHPASLRKHP
ncbi:MAG TPA: hypothetical protein PLM77_18405 [Phycisphaerae bacterium]|nr:hypothetical protein [Phycisphaerae bacterium]